MKFNLTPDAMAQGRETQQDNFHKPANAGGSAGSLRSDLSKPKQNMAGNLPQFLQDYVGNPQEKKRRDEWGQRFAMSNQGAEFNIAKMNGGQLPGITDGGNENAG